MSGGLREEWLRAVEDSEMALLLIRMDQHNVQQISLSDRDAVFARHMFDDDRGVGMDLEGQGFVLVETDAQVVVSPESDMIGVLSGTDSETLRGLIDVISDLGWQQVEIAAGPLTVQSVNELTGLRPYGCRVEFLSAADKQIEQIAFSLRSTVVNIPVESAPETPEIVTVETATPRTEDAADKSVIAVAESSETPSPTPTNHMADAWSNTDVLKPELAKPLPVISPPQPILPTDFEAQKEQGKIPAPSENSPTVLETALKLALYSVELLTKPRSATMDPLAPQEDTATHIESMRKLITSYPVSKSTLMSAPLGQAVRWYTNEDTTDVRQLVEKVVPAGLAADLLIAVILHLGYTDNQEPLTWAAVAEWLRNTNEPQGVAEAMLTGITQHDPHAKAADGYCSHSPFVQFFADKLQKVKNVDFFPVVAEALQQLHEFGETAQITHPTAEKEVNATGMHQEENVMALLKGLTPELAEQMQQLLAMISSTTKSPGVS